MDALTAIATVSQASSPFLLVLAIWAFLTGRVVPRWVYDAAERRAEQWQRMSEGKDETISRSLRLAERKRAG